MLLPSFFVLGLVDEFERSVRTEGPESNWSNEFTEFTDSDFEKYLEGHRDKVAEAESTYSVRPRCNGVIDSAVACCAGGPGSIPAVGISKSQYSDGFLA